MGMYVNTGNTRFQGALKSEIYVDKTGLLAFLNSRIGREKCYIVVSRARRFGKSMAADMMQAYYCHACDSSEMFAPYEIARPDEPGEDKGYLKHLNKYNVLMLDMGSFVGASAESGETPLENMARRVKADMKAEFPEALQEIPMTIAEGIQAVYQHTKRQFVIIIDEWDCIIRENPLNSQIVQNYIKFLRSLFKSNESKDFLALAYITGILPIKKLEGESVVNDFDEYTMINPAELYSYFGFTSKELETLADRYGMDLEALKKWYDGYRMNGEHMYNPNSVVLALMHREMRSYWTGTSSYETINDYMEMDYDGLRDAAIRLISGDGERIKVNVTKFKNDLNDIRSRDDCLTALIHLGYLGYDADKGEAFIPNYEVSEAFEAALSTGKWDDIRDALEKSDALLEATLEGNESAVARSIQQSRMDYSSIIAFNDENALASAIMIAYYTARRDYVIVREFPSGRGFADIAFIPRKGCPHPPMIVELKWNASAEAAIDQIKAKKYAGKLAEYSGEILLVGISYSKESGETECIIEKRNSGK